MIPKEISSNPVRWVAYLEEPIFPKGYPGDGDLEKTIALTISVSDEDEPEYKLFWVSCVGINGKIMAGDMCYTLESAQEVLTTEFNVKNLIWNQV